MKKQYCQVVYLFTFYHNSWWGRQQAWSWNRTESECQNRGKYIKWTEKEFCFGQIETSNLDLTFSVIRKWFLYEGYFRVLKECRPCMKEIWILKFWLETYKGTFNFPNHACKGSWENTILFQSYLENPDPNSIVEGESSRESLHSIGCAGSQGSITLYLLVPGMEVMYLS